MLKEFIEYLSIIKKYSNYTIKAYQEDILEYYQYLKENHLDEYQIDEESSRLYLAYLYQNNINKASISRKLSSIRSYYRFLVNENKVKINYFSYLKNPKKDQKLPNYLEENEMNKLLSITITDNPLHQRNTVILEMLYATGVRVGELVNIKINDLDPYNQTIRILGKGNKVRYVIYNNHTKNILNIYLNDGYIKLNNNHNEYLFLNKLGNKITERAIRNILDEFISKSSLEKHISPHTLRHTFATHLLNEGADLVSVKELLGHSSLSTTSIYTHVTNEQIRKVYDQAHPHAKDN